MLIVNADDFGYNAMTNMAIVKSFKMGLCSSATLMANMEGFEEACELIHAHGLLEHVGLHLNLSEGTPLTDALRRCPRFCDRLGHFHMERRVRVLWLSGAERAALAAEVWAQVRRLQARGLQITHVDSHKNLHEEWGIAAIIVPLVKQAGIPGLRLARNIGWQTSLLKSFYRNTLNKWLSRQGLARTHYFGSLQDYVSSRTQPNFDAIAQSCEIMIHPVFDREGELVDLLSRLPLESVAQQYDGISRAISYCGHHYSPLTG